MTHKMLFPRIIPAFAIAVGLWTSPALKAQIPLDDNQNPPFMGIYEAPPSKDGIKADDEYAAWLNRTLVYGHSSEGWEHWDGIEHAHWLFPSWSKWVAEKPGRRAVFSIPLIPVKDPKTGEVYNLKDGASGAYDGHFKALATTLVQQGLTNSILRLGWEFDGGWYPWNTRTAENATYYAQAYRHAVLAMRSVPGAEKLTFCWNGCGESLPYALDAAYPGDDCVDYIGFDIYDKTWAKDVYPYPPMPRRNKNWSGRKKPGTFFITGNMG